MGSMFKKATEIKTEAPKKKGKEKEQLSIKGLRQIAILDAVVKQATAMLSTLKAEVNSTGFAHFVGLAGKVATRPSSFEGVDGVATASVEVRKRSSGSVLTEDEVKVLTDAGLDVAEKVIQPHLFAINPAYASDEALLEKVEKAIAKIVPADFIVQQQEVKKPVVSDEMLDEAFKEGASEEVLRILTTMALKPKLTADYDMSHVLTDAVEIMQPSKKPVGKPQLKSVGK
jgi:hypothetical protein